MSDYIYMLESHLSPDQNRVVEETQAAAGLANVNVFLTGGAMRDMLAGFRIRDLDFVVEGNALKIAKAICERTGATTVSTDENRKSAELVFPSGVTAQIAMSRQEKYARAGAKPQVSPATIQEDLRGRDFTCNAIALSLNRASRGLLLDPMNGLADIERKELRAVSTYGFYDDPSRLLRLVRLPRPHGLHGGRAHPDAGGQRARSRSGKAHSGARPGRRTEAHQRRRQSHGDLQRPGRSRSAAALLAGAADQTEPAGLARYEKAIRVLPDDARWRAARFGTFLYCLTEKLTPKDKQALIKATDMPKSDVDQWQKIEARAKKLEAALRAPRVRKPSHVYHIVAAAAPEDVLFVLYHSALKPVQERLRNHFQKYLPDGAGDHSGRVGDHRTQARHAEIRQGAR